MCLSEGTVFDQQEQAPLPVAGSVEGFAEALKKMQRGGRYKIIIPPEKGYKDQAAGAIPPNSTLYFDVERPDFRNAAEVRAMMQQMQQMQGAPGGPPPTGTPPPSEPALAGTTLIWCCGLD